MKPFVHRCVVQEGSAAGNKSAQEVTSGDFLYNNECQFCGGKKATLEDLVIHMYEELTEEEDDL